MKPRDLVPGGLTRDGSGEVDARSSGSDLHRCADEHTGTRFGRPTDQMLCDQPTSPAHQEETWKSERRRIRDDYLAWAEPATP